MSKFLSVLVITLLFGFTSSGCAANKKNAQNASSSSAAGYIAAPQFSEKDVFGKSVITLADYKGKVVLLNFWATWCPPCKAEIPDLITISKEYAKDFSIIGISLDQDGPEVVRKFYKEYKLNYPVIMATPEMVNSYGGITAIPTSFILNRKGEVVHQIVGFRNKQAFEDMIKPLIAESAN